MSVIDGHYWYHHVSTHLRPDRLRLCRRVCTIQMGFKKNESPSRQQESTHTKRRLYAKVFSNWEIIGRQSLIGRWPRNYEGVSPMTLFFRKHSLLTRARTRGEPYTQQTQAIVRECLRNPVFPSLKMDSESFPTFLENFQSVLSCQIWQQRGTLFLVIHV